MNYSLIRFLLKNFVCSTHTFSSSSHDAPTPHQRTTTLTHGPDDASLRSLVPQPAFCAQAQSSQAVRTSPTVLKRPQLLVGGASAPRCPPANDSAPSSTCSRVWRSRREAAKAQGRADRRPRRACSAHGRAERPSSRTGQLATACRLATTSRRPTLSAHPLQPRRHSGNRSSWVNGCFVGSIRSPSLVQGLLLSRSVCFLLQVLAPIHSAVPQFRLVLVLHPSTPTLVSSQPQLISSHFYTSKKHFFSWFFLIK